MKSVCIKQLAKHTKLQPVIKVFTKNLETYVKLMRVISAGRKDISPRDNQSLERKFIQETDQLLKNADRLVIKLNDEKLRMTLKDFFRETLRPWMCRGEIVKRGYEKPRGYPGDYRTLEMIYDEQVIAKDRLGAFFDKYLLNNFYVIAVRNRKEKMKELIREFVISRPPSSHLRILNIASGGARDVRELIQERGEILCGRQVEVVLVDQDKEALAFSQKQLRSLNAPIKINYINENIINFFRGQDAFREELGEFDMIYSIGLIDYISDALLTELIKFAFQILKFGGVLVLAIKNTKTYRSIASDWFCDWNFYLRDENELICLIERTLRGKFRLRCIPGFDKYITFISVAKR